LKEKGILAAGSPKSKAKLGKLNTEQYEGAVESNIQHSNS